MAASNRRRRTTRNTTLPHLQDDTILQEILPNLPVKSLLRFKCVCKLWESRISDPTFQLSKNRTRTKALVFSTKYLRCFSLNHYSGFERLKTPSEFYNDFTRPRLLGSANGLVLASVGKNIFLWNPATSYCDKVLQLDRLSYISCKTAPWFFYEAVSTGFFYEVVSAGFFYDPSIEDYRVLMYLCRLSPPGGGQYVISTTLKSKKWEIVDGLHYNLTFVCHGPMVNGRLHWSVSECPEWLLNSATNTILSFDWMMNKFVKVPMPEPVRDGGDDIAGLGSLGGCLCMVRRATSFGWRDRSDFQVHIMKQYGVKESWTMMFRMSNISCCPFLRRIQLLMNSAEEKNEAFYFYMEGNIKVYNTSTGKMETMKLIGNKHYESIEFTYEETLISPKRYSWNDKEHNVTVKS